MKKSDKILAGIVIGIVLLVGVAFAVALTRPKPDYREEDTPEGVAHNYLLALQQEDYERAYGYLSTSMSDYPLSLRIFTDDIENYSDADVNSTTQVDTPATIKGDRATVKVQHTRFYQGGLFSSRSYSSTFDMTLVKEEGKWRIIASDRYWSWRWR